MQITEMVDATVYSRKRGTSLALPNALRSKNFTKSLISGASVVDSTNGAVLHTRDNIYVLAPGYEWNGDIIIEGVRNNNLFLIPATDDDLQVLKFARECEKAPELKSPGTCMYTTFSGDIPLDVLMHQRFGHRSMSRLRTVFKDKLDSTCGTKCTCHSCCSVKLKAGTFKRTTPPTEYRPGGRIDADDVPKRIKSKAGNIHTEFVIDYSSRRIFLTFLKSKSEVASAIKDVKAKIENLTGKPVQVIQCDAGPWNTTPLLIDDCKRTGTQVRTANPGDLKQNGFCERHIGIWKQVGFLIDHHAGGLPPSFWEYKERQAALILNLWPNYKREDGSYWSPTDLWNDVRDIDRGSRLRVYGCLAYIYVHEKDRMRGINGHRAVYLGEFCSKSIDRKAFVFLDLDTKTIVSSCQCIFIETELPFRTSNWISRPILDEYEQYVDQTAKGDDSQTGGEEENNGLSPIRYQFLNLFLNLVP
jgi:hypothetical protein